MFLNERIFLLVDANIFIIDFLVFKEQLKILGN